MSDLDQFGITAGAHDLGAGVKDTLIEWLPTYLAYESRKVTALDPTIGYLPTPGAYVVSNDPDHFPEEAPPAVVIAIPGTLDEPILSGNRYYRAIYDVRVIVYVDGQSRDSTDALARYYSEAILLCMIGKPAMNGAAAGVKWTGEGYGVKESDVTQRTLSSGENRFRVEVQNVAKAFGGPLTPTVTMPTDWPTVTSVQVTAEPESL